MISSGLMHAKTWNCNMKYGFTSWYIRVIHETLQEQSWIQLLNEEQNNLPASCVIREKTAYCREKKKKKRRVIEDRWRERWSDERCPISQCSRRWMVCVWVELSLVWCWLCMRWCSAGQMVLVGRWVNNDVSPQCSNYLLLGPHGRMHARIWMLAHTESCMPSWISTYIY